MYTIKYFSILMIILKYFNSIINVNYSITVVCYRLNYSAGGSL